MAWRLPPPAIEAAALNGLRSFLCDRRRLIETLVHNGTAADRLQAILSRAAALAEILGKASPAEQRRVLLEIITRIDVAEERVRITLPTHTLRIRIAAGEPAKGNGVADSSAVVIDLPATFRRRGVEMKLVIDGDRASSSAPDQRLIALVAQARQWFAELTSGEARSVHDLASRHRIDRGDASRILPLAFLAPDIVQAIVDGRQPVELTTARLKRLRDLPASWTRQRRLLGFS